MTECMELRLERLELTDNAEEDSLDYYSHMVSTALDQGQSETLCKKSTTIQTIFLHDSSFIINQIEVKPVKAPVDVTFP